MNCRQCEKPIPTENVNLATQVAKCNHCQAIFRFDAQREFQPQPAEPIKPGIVKPKHFSLIDSDQEKKIIVNPRKLTALTCLVSTCLCFSLALYLMFKTVVEIQSTWHAEYVFATIAVVFLFLVLLSRSFCFLWNPISIEVDENSLFTTHFPASRNNKRLPRESISQICIEKSGIGNPSNFSIQYYCIFALDSRGKKTNMCYALEIHEARFIVYWLNRWLNLSPSRLGVQIFEPPAANQAKSLS